MRIVTLLASLYPLVMYPVQVPYEVKDLGIQPQHTTIAERLPVFTKVSTSITSSCGCTAVSPSILQPGHTDLQITLDTGILLGVQSTQVQFSDGTQVRYKYHVVSNLDWIVEPQVLTAKPGWQSIQLKSRTQASITDIHLPEYIITKLVPGTLSIATKDAPYGTYQTTITLITTTGQVTIPISINNPSTLFQSTLHMGAFNGVATQYYKLPPGCTFSNLGRLSAQPTNLKDTYKLVMRETNPGIYNFKVTVTRDNRVYGYIDVIAVVTNEQKNT